MLIAALFVIAKQLECPSTSVWINTLEHLYSGILLSNKNNELLIYTTTWVNHKYIMLNERSNRMCDSIYRHPGKGKIVGTENRLWSPEAGGEREGCLQRTQGNFFG